MVTIRCSACMGTGSMESEDSTDDRWWDCTLCSGTGQRTIPDRRRPPEQVYPYEEGDTIVLGPQIFASADSEVINWKGTNYVKQGLAHLAGIGGAARACTCPIGHSHQ